MIYQIGRTKLINYNIIVEKGGGYPILLVKTTYCYKITKMLKKCYNNAIKMLYNHKNWGGYMILKENPVTT